MSETRPTKFPVCGHETIHGKYEILSECPACMASRELLAMYERRQQSTISVNHLRLALSDAIAAQVAREGRDCRESPYLESLRRAITTLDRGDPLILV